MTSRRSVQYLSQVTTPSSKKAFKLYSPIIITNQCLLAFNVTKCEYLIASRKRQQLQISSPFTLAGQPIDRVDQYHYLSVLITSIILEQAYWPDLC